MQQAYGDNREPRNGNLFLFNYGRPPLNRQRRPPESLFRLYLYSLRGLAQLVQPFGCDVGAVLPEDGLVKAELDELFRIAQFLECGI